MKRLNNYEIRPSRHLVVTKSVDNRRLWVNGIPKNRSGQEIRLEMERLTGGVRDIILYPSQVTILNTDWSFNNTNAVF